MAATRVIFVAVRTTTETGRRDEPRSSCSIALDRGAADPRAAKTMLPLWT